MSKPFQQGLKEIEVILREIGFDNNNVELSITFLENLHDNHSKGKSSTPSESNLEPKGRTAELKNQGLSKKRSMSNLKKKSSQNLDKLVTPPISSISFSVDSSVKGII